ncbi:hypothetical protein AYL99_09454 [Fonsecaea erecta]|uniref:DNA (cytosine-5-)-methyltransferase n=1 Tax=Fonsecaea erecta TaxID=1367422 RepID=A0A178ZB11_9EURO|nr:hypothetical protein AYL99_09454 [Fonsecaea erecta]OAP56275.1 hypothetical protein AYL99_09454 [Fonsecaea erecta]
MSYYFFPSPAFRQLDAITSPEDDDYDGYESDPDFEADDGREVLKKSLHHLGLAKNYTPQWRREDAFREFYQNWKDGIVASFGVDPRFFKPVFDRNDDREIHITARTESGHLLGYIRFNGKQGTLELTNFKAKLDRKHLALGATSKRNNDTFAGGHGEGFKLAALVMRRNGHSVMFETNSFRWNFSFRGSDPHLCCLLNNPRPKLLREQRDEYERRQRSARDAHRGLTSYIWEDMTVKIGKSRDREGAQKVSEQDFRAWMRVSIDLDPPDPTQSVPTITGHLIFDPRFRNRIYLHGLLVSESAGDSQGGKSYHFGYNFHRGKINRDRQRMTDQDEEARTLASIWEQAIVLRGNFVIDAYIKLFAEDEEASDVVQAYRYMGPVTAQNLCRRLKESHPEAFFYADRGESERNATTDEDIISKELKKRPLKLGKKIWSILRKEPPLMRTPLEERNHLFESSQRIEPGQDIFGLNIIRALNGAFTLHPELSNVNIEFVDGADTAIDLLYAADRNLLRIHAKWLDVARVHEGSCCEFFKVAGEQLTSESAFFCDHVVQDLLAAAFEEVRTPLGLTLATAAWLRRNANEYLRKMPRAIRMRFLDAGKKLKVEWVGNESGAFTVRYGANIQYCVTLHKESTCGRRKTEVLNVAATHPASEQPAQVNDLCDCPTRTVTQVLSKAIFDGLDPNASYFPMVSRAETPSFFGLPPPSSHHLTASASESGSNYGSSYDTLKEEDSDSDETVDLEARDPQPSARPEAVVLQSTRVQDDEHEWQEWHQQHCQSNQTRVSPPPNQAFEVDAIVLPSIYCMRLRLTLEQGCYYHVLLAGEEREQVIFVHNTSFINIRSGHGYSLLVTKYSFLSSIFSHKNPPSSVTPIADDQEVILHFCDFDKMRAPQDAEAISLDDILSAYRVGTGRDSVSHIPRHRADTKSETLFCRFGISEASADGRVNSMTPLAPHLLLHQENRSQRSSFPSETPPVAFDLSPSVLGVSEGFAASGFTIQAAFGLDERRHTTWMNRHGIAQCFDGPIPRIFKDFDSGKLQPIRHQNPALPKVLLFAHDQTCFRLNAQNCQMPTLHQFLKPLDAVQKAVEVLRPDFLVMLLPPAVRHPSAMARFSKMLFNFLEMGFSVHSTLIRLSDYGVPQERSILATIASPDGVPMPWKLDDYTAGRQLPATIGSLIGDLAFENPRLQSKPNTGFVCKLPTRPGSAAGASKPVYNHYTGIRVAPSAPNISMDSEALYISSRQKVWIHPVRRDRVTVRELARLQGIADELPFSGSIEDQYETVCKALPPIVAEMIAHTIREAIDNSRVVPVSGGGGNNRRKRARVMRG